MLTVNAITSVAHKDGTATIIVQGDTSRFTIEVSDEITLRGHFPEVSYPVEDTNGENNFISETLLKYFGEVIGMGWILATVQLATTTINTPIK